MIAAALAVSLGAKPRRLKEPGPKPIVPGTKVYLLKPDGTSPAKEGRLIITPHTELYDDDGNFSVATDVEVPRFDPGADAVAYLQTHGYVVIKEVLNSTDLALAEELMWAYFEDVGVDRDEPETWKDAKPNQYGIFWQYGSGHSRFLWHIRTRPRLLEAFELFWNTSELLTSFEGFSMFPPASVEDEWLIAESWFHTDQNAASRPGLQTIQSFTSLYDQDEHTGAFVVVPRSHDDHLGVTQRVYEDKWIDPDTQFLMVPPNDQILLGRTHPPPHVVRVRAGDSVLWDSRTVHCNTPPMRNRGAAPPVSGARARRPNRVVAYAAMAPRSKATASVLQQRLTGFRKQQTCTHWPFEFICLDPPAALGEPSADAMRLALDAGAPPSTPMAELVLSLVGAPGGEVPDDGGAEERARRERARRKATAKPIAPNQCPAWRHNVREGEINSG